MKGINPSFNLVVFLIIFLTFSAFPLPIAEAQQSSANKTDNIPEGPWLGDGEFIFPEYSNGVLNPVEAQSMNDLVHSLRISNHLTFKREENS